MSSREVSEWMAYEKVTGPLGPERQDHLSALSAYYIASALGVKKLRVDKLLPKWDRSSGMKWQDFKAYAEAITRQQGGRVIRKDEV